MFTTPSLRNHEYLRKLGAARIWDYNASSVVADRVGELSGKRLARVVSMRSALARPRNACRFLRDAMETSSLLWLRSQLLRRSRRTLCLCGLPWALFLPWFIIRFVVRAKGSRASRCDWAYFGEWDCSICLHGVLAKGVGTSQLCSCSWGWGGWRQPGNGPGGIWTIEGRCLGQEASGYHLIVVVRGYLRCLWLYSVDLFVWVYSFISWLTYLVLVWYLIDHGSLISKTL